MTSHDSDRHALSLRFLIWTPIGKDAVLTATVLDGEAIKSVICTDLASVKLAVDLGAGALLVAEEAVSTGVLEELAAFLALQESWSDFPVLLLTLYGADSTTVSKGLKALGNVTLLERPVRPSTLVSAVQTALKARERQYQLRAQLVEQSRTNDALEKSEGRLRAIVDQAMAGIAQCDLDGRFLIVNPRFCDIVDYTNEQLLSVRHQDLTHPLDWQSNRQEHSQLLGEQVGYVIEKRYIRPDGRPGCNRDRCRRKCHLLESLYGWTWGEVMGRSIVDLVVDSSAVSQAGEIFEILKVGKSWSGEILMRHRSGKTFPAFVTDTPVFDAQGGLQAIIGVSTDVTERKRIEEELRDADRRKDDFLATLAHELRNPLAPIRNSLHILQLSSDGDSVTADVCEMLERQVAHLVRLVDVLMEVSRITRGKIELRTEPVNLAAIVRSAVEECRPMIDASKHQLAISLPAEPIIINGDAVRLSQVFANLLNNAAKYMNDGGQIWLAVKKRYDNVVVSIRDTGIGIPEEMLPHIFKMFMQVDRSSRRAQGGLGIGLSLVKTLVEMHCGQVEVHSSGMDQGSEFVVQLPLIHEIDNSEKRVPDIRSTVLPNRRVLVVDDNRDAAATLGMLLRLLGADVRVVNDGPAALEVLPTYQPTVVLLDIGMPGMDGYEVARRIRQKPECRDLMLIALTGWGQEEDRRRTNQAGFDHHL